MPRTKSVKIVFWSKAGQSRWDTRLLKAVAKPAGMAFEPEGRFYAGNLAAPAEGTLVLSVFSPRPLRLWIGGAIVLDEGLSRTWYERSVTAAVVVPCPKGEVDFLVEVGPRSLWWEGMDRDCPSRNRAYVRAELGRRLPDRLSLEGFVTPGVAATAVSMRFLRAQFRRDGVTWQHVLVRPASGFKSAPPTLDYVSPTDEPTEPLLLRSTILPCDAIEGTTDAQRAVGVRRFFVPVANDRDEPAPLREPGRETRIEPTIEVARMLSLTVEGPGGAVSLAMPGYEGLGRLAPHREFGAVDFPSFDAIRDQLPEPVLPASLDRYRKTYYEAWRMLLALVCRYDIRSCDKLCFRGAVPVMKRLRSQIIHRLQLRESWIIFFILGIIMMTFPFLHIFNKPVLLFGLPLMFLYFTAGWIISIIVIYLFMLAIRHGNKSNTDKNEP